MSPLHVMVDVERLVSGWLKTVTEVTGVVGTRVYTVLPATPTFPLVRLERIGGVPRPGPLHLDIARLQIEAWGDGTASSAKAQARDLAAVVHAALHEELPGHHDLGTVTAVETDLGLTWSPDPETGRDRYLFGVAVYTHPNPT